MCYDSTWCNEYNQAETGWYYLNSRYYDPNVGRFLNADGVVGANGGIQGYNMFAYCNNNPVMGYDPSGYCDHMPMWDAGDVCWCGDKLDLNGTDGFDWQKNAVIACAVASDTVVFSNPYTAAAAAVAIIGVIIYVANSSEEVLPPIKLPKREFGSTIFEDDNIIEIVYDKGKYEDPYSRPGQKEQGREIGEKKKKNDGWEDRSNQRRIKLPKKHTPGKDHRKYKDK